MKLSFWLLTIPSRGTRRKYRSILRKFFSVAIAETVEDLDDFAELYLERMGKEPEAHMRAVDRFFVDIQELAPMTQSGYISNVRTWLREQYIQIPDGYWRKFSRRIDPQPLTIEKVPTSEDIRRITPYMDVIGKAIFTFISASGCRIGETCLIELDDMDLTSDPPRVHLRKETTKSRRARTVFFTDEAKEAIEAFLRVRVRYIETAEKKDNVSVRPRPEDERRLFPLHAHTARWKWRLALKKAGKYHQDERTRFMTMRPHTLRKRFRTQLAAVIPVDVVEVLMGHRVYMSMYQRYTQKELAEFYKEGEHVLYLSSDPAELKRLSRQMKEKEKEVEAVKLKLLELEARIAEEELRKVKD